MDKLQQKLKKERHTKDNKDKHPQNSSDVRNINENLKIKEILRTVKMNNSMRMTAPTGNNLMSNHDCTEDDGLEIEVNEHSSEPLCATNPDVQVINNVPVVSEENLRGNCSNDMCENCEDDSGFSRTFEDTVENREDEENTIDNNSEINSQVAYGKTNENIRNRKLSLDHSVLSRQDRFSQSELDLHSIGKSPLEQKSSFFRRKMDSFVRNTTEMFRRQNRSLQRRVSMSVSLQSLNEKCQNLSSETNSRDQQGHYGSRSSLKTPAPIVRSTSSLSLRQSIQPASPSPQNSLAGSQHTLHALSASTLEDIHSGSDLSLNDSYLREAMLKSRAISMNSGLDSPFGLQRKKSSRSNRVTWIASEGLTNYLRRKIQDENLKQIQSSLSYQDFSCIPEHELYCQKTDTKGRRLSYQRAVSGEDPVMPLRHQDSTLRRRNQVPDTNEWERRRSKVKDYEEDSV